MSPSELPEESLKALREVVEDLDLSPSDLLEALSAVVSIKKQKDKEKQGLKIYKEKTFLWGTLKTLGSLGMEKPNVGTSVSISTAVTLV